MTRLPLLSLLGFSLLLVATPQRAKACSAVAAHIAIDPHSGSLVPVEGVIVLSATDYGGEPPDVIVRDADGGEVEGELSVIGLRDLTPTTGDGGFPSGSAPVRLVWRAALPLVADATYMVEVVSGTSWTELEPFVVTVEATPFEGLSEAAAIASIGAERRRVSADLRVSCDYSDYDGMGGCPFCRFTDLTEMTTVDAELAIDVVDHYTIHRLVPETGAPIVRDAIWIGASSLHFPEEAEEYCFHVESESLIDGSIASGASTCIAAADVTPLPEEPPVDPIEPIDPVSDDPSATTSGGCSATGPQPVSTFALGGLLLAALFGRRRRR